MDIGKVKRIEKTFLNKRAVEIKIYWMNECQFIFEFLVIFYYFENEDRMEIMITYIFLLL